ncbi:MAG: HAMP domain-containing sensor histidine kinase, partial [Bacteroidota bacterium]
ARENPQPKIEIKAHKNNEGKTFIEVKDNGPGIPQDVMDKIFVPFFTTKKEGSGIGLSLSRQIMRLHKGNIEVNSVEGKGTVFTLSL